MDSFLRPAQLVKSKTGISPSPGDSSPSLTPSWLNSSHNIFQIAQISQSWNKVTFTKQPEYLILHRRSSTSQIIYHGPKQQGVVAYLLGHVIEIAFQYDPTWAKKCIGVSFVCRLPDILGSNKNASEWELKLPVHCSAERISRRSERRRVEIFKEGKISMKTGSQTTQWLRLIMRRGPLLDCVAHVTRMSPPGVKHQVSVIRICLEMPLYFYNSPAHISLSPEQKAPTGLKHFKVTTVQSVGDREWGFCNAIQSNPIVGAPTSQTH